MKEDLPPNQIPPEARVGAHGGQVRKALLVVLLVAGALLRTSQFDYPWTTDFRGQCGSRYSNVARNFVNLGFTATKGAPIDSINPQSPDDFIYYLNHPPLLEWLVALSFKAFGMKELTARLVPFVFSFLTMVLLFLLAKRLWNETAALCVLAIFCILPMGVFYGTLVDVQGVLPLFFIILILFLYQRFVDRPGKTALALLYAAFVIGMLSDWPVYYLAVLLPLYHLFMRRKRKLAVAAMFPTAILMTLAYVLYGNWITTGKFALDFGHLQSLARSRGSYGIPTLSGLGGPAARFGEIWLTFFTWPALVMLGAWLIAIPLIRVLRKGANAYWIVWFFFIFAVLHIALFPEPAQKHEYWSYYLLPSVALAGGLTLYFAGRLFSGLLRGYAVIVQGALLVMVFIFSWTHLQELYNVLGQVDFALIGRQIDSACDKHSYILIDWDGYQLLSFYVHNQMFYGPINRVNYRMMDNNPRARYILMTNPEVAPFKQRFGLELFDQEKRNWPPQHYGRLSLVRMLDTKGLNRFDYPASIDPPKVQGVQIENRKIVVRWSHPHPENVSRYRIYRRNDKTPFYPPGTDVDKDATEAAIDNYSRDKLWLVIVAVDKDNEESDFDREVKCWPDDGKG
jgi:hypothetical protein